MSTSANMNMTHVDEDKTTNLLPENTANNEATQLNDAMEEEADAITYMPHPPYNSLNHHHPFLLHLALQYMHQTHQCSVKR